MINPNEPAKAGRPRFFNQADVDFILRCRTDKTFNFDMDIIAQEVYMLENKKILNERLEAYGVQV